MAEDRITQLARRYGVDEEGLLAGAEMVARGMAVTPEERARWERKSKARKSVKRQQREADRKKHYPDCADLAPIPIVHEKEGA